MKLRARRWWRRRLARYGGVYLVVALALAFGGCADRLILFPQTGRAENPMARAVMVPFAGRNVEIWIERPEAPAAEPESGRMEAEAPLTGPEAFVLSFNGNADRAETAVNAEAYIWRGKPIEVWAVNYPGYGGSEGSARLADLGAAGCAAYDALGAHARGRPIIVSGTSLGTAVALHVAARRPVAGVVLTNPPPLQNMILNRYGWWNLWLFAGPVAMGIPADLNSLRNGPMVRAPAVIVLSEDDGVVPLRFQRKVYAAYAGVKRQVLLGGGHNDAPRPAEERQIREALSWLWEQAVAARAGGATSAPATGQTSPSPASRSSDMSAAGR